MPQDPKTEHLRSRGLLHPHPEKVKDELFHSGPFFDPHDLLQVRYEMLRRRRVEKLSEKIGQFEQVLDPES